MVIMKRISIGPTLLIIGLVSLSCGRETKSDEKIISEKVVKPESKVETRIFDETNLLSEEQEQGLFKLIQELEDSIGSQIAIIIVDTLSGEKIEGFAVRKVKELDLGRDVINDGLLIAIVYKAREMRIEIGFGLERIITDEIAAQIIRELMVPKFREQKYYEGIYAAVVKVKNLIEEKKQLIGQPL
jgi:uncharacterized membrane protein YgcG